MKVSEFKRWLADQGATFENGSRHTKVYLNGQKTIMPRHPGTEMKTGTVEAIKKQLKLK